jgi:uncharacterized protein (DUF2062 family)
MAESFVRRHLVGPFVALLKQGITPEKVALSIALGVVCGLFPIMGATTLLCIAAASAMRLNQVAIQVVNYLMSPLQVGGILLFVRLGEWLVGAEPVPFSPAELARSLRADPGAFFSRFGWTGVHGILGWSVVAPFVALALYAAVIPLLRRAAAEMGPEAEALP